MSGQCFLEPSTERYSTSRTLLKHVRAYGSARTHASSNNQLFFSFSLLLSSCAFWFISNPLNLHVLHSTPSPPLPPPLLRCWIPPRARSVRSQRAFREIKLALADITRKLIDEEDEVQLVALFRETKKLKAKLDALAGRPALPPRKPRDPSKKKRPVSAAGLLTRTMALPGADADGPATADSSSTLPSRPKAAEVLKSVGDLPGRPAGSAEDAGYIPPPTKEGEASEAAEEDEGEWDGEEQEYFVCSECGIEDYGWTDERDNEFYCNACW